MANFLQIIKKLLPMGSNPALAKLRECVSPSENPKSPTDVEHVIAAIRARTPVILVHGRAGTGKTTLIREVTKQGNFKHVVVAPTGIAALNAHGQTIHSFFAIPPYIVDLKDIKATRRIREIVGSLELLVIDEISMVRADVLDVMNKTLQVNRGNRLPFGGVSTLMVGDFLQLPPVVTEEDREILMKKGYEVHYAFGAHCLRNISPLIIELSTVHRQTEANFIELLGKVRTAEDVEAVVETLNTYCHGEHKTVNTPVILCATNASADGYNREGMNRLTGVSSVFHGTVEGDFRADRYPAPKELEIKLDARVMLVKNDSGKRWVNGTLGTITRIAEGAVWICIDGSSSEYQVDRCTWESINYEWSASESRLKQKVVGRYSQYPLKLAWALTIHKSQGLTLKDVRIDMGGGAFTHGQTYVALSRTTSLKGLSFASPLLIGDVKADQDVVSGIKRFG